MSESQNSSSGTGPTGSPPSKHPQQNWIDERVRAALNERLGSGGGGGGGSNTDQRLAQLERDMAVVKAQSATKEDLAKQTGELREVIAALPMKVFVSVFAALGGLASIAFLALRYIGAE